MKKLFKSEQSGRSMVEMLGVLAIIGVLSVAGIAGYSKAMGKFKASKTTDQVATIVANIRTIYAGQRNYANLTNAVAIGIGAIPNDMLGGTAGTIINAFGGQVTISTVSVNGVANMGFAVTYQGLSQDACANIATSDWGSGSNTGLLAMAVANTAYNAANAAPATTTAPTTNTSPLIAGAQNLPIAPSFVVTACSSNSNNTVVWYYF